MQPYSQSSGVHSYHFWIKGAQRCSLTARKHIESTDPGKWFTTAANSTYLDEVEQWCLKHRCGRRVHHDTFIFKNNKHKMLFQMCWG